MYPTDATAVVYFYQRSDGLIKIGTTRNLKQRRGDIEVGAGPLKLLALITGSFLAEKQLHRKFAKSRVFGEWFTPDDELLEFIEIARSRT